MIIKNKFMLYKNKTLINKIIIDKTICNLRKKQTLEQQNMNILRSKT